MNKTWRFDPKHQSSTVLAMRRAAHGRRTGLSVRDPEGAWHCLASVWPEQEWFQEWTGAVTGIRLSLPLTPTIDFGFVLRCGSSSLRVDWDELVDGLVVIAGEQPIAAFAGPAWKGIPPGLLYLHAPTDPGDRQVAALLHNQAVPGLWGFAGRLPFESLEPLSRFESLKTLRIFGASGMRTLRGAESLPLLRTLELGNCEVLESIDDVGCLPLESLHVHGCPSIMDLAVVHEQRSLKSLLLESPYIEVSGLRELCELEELALINANLPEQERRGQVLPLRALPKLRRLDLAFTDWPADGSDLLCAPGLQYLDLSFNERLVSVTPLLRLPQLKELILNGCEVSDLSALVEAPSLRRLEWHDEVAAATVLARSLARRCDSHEIWFYSVCWTTMVERAGDTCDLAVSFADALAGCSRETWAPKAFAALVRGMKSNRAMDRSTWAAVFEAALGCGDPFLRPVFEEALKGVPLASDVLIEAVRALARVPATASTWSRERVEAVIKSLQTIDREPELRAALAGFLFVR